MSPDPQGTAPEGVSGPPAAPTGPSVTVMPVTGEILDLRESPTDQLALWRLRALELERELNALKSDLDREVVRRMDYEGLKSAEIGGFVLEIPPAMITEWDVPRLGIALQALVTDGRISPAVAEKAFRVTVTRAPAAAHLKKLLGHADPEVRESIERCRTTVENTKRRVAVRLVR